MKEFEQLVIEEFAEKLSLEDFDNYEGVHTFSLTYQKKRKKLQKKINKQGHLTEWSTNKLAAAAVFMIIVPTTAYGAKTFYEWYVNKNNHELTISLKNEDEKKSAKKYYQLALGDVPKEMELEGNHLNFKNQQSKEGVIFNLWRIRKDVSFQELSTESYEEKSISGHKSMIVKKVEDELDSFNRTVYMVFEKEHILVEASVAKNMSDEALLKILEKVSLKEVEKEKSDYIFDEKDFEKRFADYFDSKEEKIKGLPKNSDNLYQADESINYKVQDKHISFDLNSVEVLDNINAVSDKQGFNQESLNHVKSLEMLDDKGQLKKFKQKEYQSGDGINEVNKVVAEREVQPKFVYLSGTVKNLSNKKITDLYMTGTVAYLEEKNQQFNYIDDKNKMYLPQSQTLNIDYFNAGNKGKNDFITLEPNETVTYQFGFFVDEDKLDKMFLPIVPFDKDHDMMNLDDNRIWMDIRQ
ncbi:hypothetical protein [Vagococcus hydrophili]|uniref:DUF4367 domain-containing protein n=1 Tax=Vagococcus hydrophili TaxID=2714947 RepID=A0A6G8AUI1_9ENTE|nr:hypothetical protein [Vagococcus hydrophili]QIL48573.1 hypothetical protein G7082_08700 [Vagococcus hydrophili]